MRQLATASPPTKAQPQAETWQFSLGRFFPAKPGRGICRDALGSPWVDEIDVALGKIIDIPCRELCSTGSGDGGDWGISVADGLAKSAAMSRSPRKIPSF